jgi:hypothetical protein
VLCCSKAAAEASIAGTAAYGSSSLFALLSIRQHTSAYVSIHLRLVVDPALCAHVCGHIRRSMRTHVWAIQFGFALGCDSIRQHTSAYATAYVSIRQHTLALGRGLVFLFAVRYCVCVVCVCVYVCVCVCIVSVRASVVFIFLSCINIYYATRSAHTASVCVRVCAWVLIRGSNMSHALMPVCLEQR